MEYDNLAAKLKKLSKRECEILWLVCDGYSYKEISEKIYLSVPTIKAYMGRVYVKLNLDILTRSERVKIIHGTVCQLLYNYEPRLGLPEPVILEPVPPRVAAMVDEDELAITTFVPAPTDIIDITPKKRDKHPFKWAIGAVSLLGLGAIAVAAVIFYSLMLNRNQTQMGLELTKAVIQLTQVAMAQENQIQPAVVQPTGAPQVIVITATQAPEQPTAIPVTAAPAPTSAPTAPPAPTIPLPFSDNFDNGPSPLWKVISGKWITVNGRYTIMNNDGWSLVALDDPTWKNYHIRVNVNIPHQMAMAQGEIGVFVRINQQPFLGFSDNSISDVYWGTISQEFWLDPIGGNKRFSIDSNSNWDIEVNGNTFIGRVNGQEVQRISMSGYESGGIALGIYCNTDLGCESFDDLQIDPLP